jgi:uncharacterized membrane protein
MQPFPDVENEMIEPRSVRAGRGWTWIVQGFQLFMRSPATWIVLLLTLFVATKLLALVPLLGVLFVLLMPVFVAGLMDGCRALEYDQPLQFGHLVRGFQKNTAQLVTIGGISLAGNLAVLMVVMGLGGEALVEMSKTFSQKPPIPPPNTEQMQAATAAVGRAFLIGTLVSLPLLMALWFAPLLVFFNDQQPFAAMKSSLIACLRNALPLLVYGAVLMGGLFIAMPLSMAMGQYDLAIWLLAPIILPSIYASYVDIFVDGQPAPAAPETTAQ